MEIYRFNSYGEVLRVWLQEQPNKGRGTARKIALQLSISTVLVSQIFSGHRLLQMDYAFQLAKFMGLTVTETEYFLLLVQYEHAGPDSYKKFLLKRMDILRESQGEIKNRVAQDIKLSEEDKAQFYSHWHYSAIRLASDIPGCQTLPNIAAHLDLPVSRVSEVLEFLVRCKLCSIENGKYKMAVRSTHLSSESPWIFSRQLQWRQKAICAMESPSKDSVFYTGPMVLSKKDSQWVRDQMVKMISQVAERAKNSPSEEIMCLNIDWFSVREV